VTRRENLLVVFFGGAALATAGARRGFAIAGRQPRIVSVELNPVAHHLAQILLPDVEHILGDVKDYRHLLQRARWAWLSPPCQEHSAANTQTLPDTPPNPLGDGSLLEWSLHAAAEAQVPCYWVENVLPQGKPPAWGTVYNAAQFLADPWEARDGFERPHGQNRNRVIGGDHPRPGTWRPYQKAFPDLCPAVTATEYKGCATDARRASRYYGRRLTLEEAAYHMGLEIPPAWYEPLPGYTPGAWRQELYRAIGNGVPLYMAEAFAIAAVEGEADGC
jgi:site-specific DNA-cytosine methylase